MRLVLKPRERLMQLTSFFFFKFSYLLIYTLHGIRRYLLCQLEECRGNYEVAIEHIDAAIAHTPTAVYMTIFKK